MALWLSQQASNKFCRSGSFEDCIWVTYNINRIREGITEAHPSLNLENASCQKFLFCACVQQTVKYYWPFFAKKVATMNIHCYLGSTHLYSSFPQRCSLIDTRQWLPQDMNPSVSPQVVSNKRIQRLNRKRNDYLTQLLLGPPLKKLRELVKSGRVTAPASPKSWGSKG